MANGGPTPPARQVPRRQTLAVHRASAELGDRTITPIDRARWRCRATQCRHERNLRSALIRRVYLGGGDRGRIGNWGLSAPAQNIVGRDRPIEALQVQIADMRDLYRTLDGTERSLRNQDLPRPSFIAEPRCEIRHAADRRVFAAMFKPDLPQCRIAGSNTDSEPEGVALSTPVLRQLLDLVAHIERQAHRTFGMIRARNRVVEDDHDAVSEKTLQRTFVLEYEFSHVLVIFAENCHDLFRFGCFGKGGEIAKVA